MFRFTAFCMLFSLFFTACGNSDAPASNDSDSVLTASTTAGTGTSCLADFEGSICDLVPHDLIKKALPEGIKLMSYKPEKRSSLSSCGYTMDHPDKVIDFKVGKRILKQGAMYSVLLKAPKVSKSKNPLQSFKMSYKVMTPEQVKISRDNLEAGIDAKVAKGEITEEEAETARGFGSLVGTSIWEQVDNLATAAAWGRPQDHGSPTNGVLMILHENVILEVAVDVVDSYEQSRDLAIEIARAILQRCE